MIEWKKIPEFAREEFDDPLHPGSGDLIHPELFKKILHLRRITGWPMIPHGIVGGCVDVDGSHGHAKDSLHLQRMGCKAIDFHFNTNESTRKQFYFVEGLFPGVGVYYDWHWFGYQLKIGFHVDMRPWDRMQRWTRRDGEYFYLLK